MLNSPQCNAKKVKVIEYFETWKKWLQENLAIGTYFFCLVEGWPSKTELPFNNNISGGSTARRRRRPACSGHNRGWNAKTTATKVFRWKVLTLIWMFLLKATIFFWWCFANCSNFHRPLLSISQMTTMIKTSHSVRF